MASRHRLASLVALLALLVVPAAPLQATNGHFLHGVGAINSAMGGAGVGAPTDLLGTIYLNPAGLIVFEPTRVDLGFEMFKPDRSVESVFGPFAGVTTSKSEFVPIPAFGWSSQLKDGRLAVGLAGLGIGGFGVDYAVTPANPILAPRPFGFGQVFSNYSLMKIVPVMAYRLNPRLSIGVAANIDWASLNVQPFPVASPAVDPGPDGVPYTSDDRAFYSNADASDGAFGFGFQAGLLYQASDQVSIGASYTSPQHFQDFRWQAVYENPFLPTYGMPRDMVFNLDIPAVYAAGIGLRPSDRLSLAADVRYITYERTDGFRESGYDETGAVKGFGWRNIKVLAIGGEFKATRALALRGGYNYSDNPIPGELSMFNVPAPGIVKHHLTLGAGLDLLPNMGLSLAYYHAFRNSGTGSFVMPTGPVPGTSLTNSLEEDALLVQFTFLRR